MKFGKLTVIERAEKTDRSGNVYWLCKCDCGKICVVQGYSLTSGNAKSCGCFHKERFNHRTHGLSNDKTYSHWNAIKKRCLNPKSSDYKFYGGRGITMYESWINDFQAFYDYVSTLEHFGEEGYTLDRIENDGNYEPGNVRWATRKEQTRNRRNTVLVEYNDEEMTLAEASERSGIGYHTLKVRFKAGDRGEYLFRPVKS